MSGNVLKTYRVGLQVGSRLIYVEVKASDPVDAPKIAVLQQVGRHPGVKFMLAGIEEIDPSVTQEALAAIGEALDRQRIPTDALPANLKAALDAAFPEVNINMGEKK